MPNIRYATNGIDIKGKPSQSPLLTDTAITETAAQAQTQEASSDFATSRPRPGHRQPLGLDRQHHHRQRPSL